MPRVVLQSLVVGVLPEANGALWAHLAATRQSSDNSWEIMKNEAGRAGRKHPQGRLAVLLVAWPRASSDLLDLLACGAPEIGTDT